MNDKKTSVRTLTMLALLVAMSIVFSRVLSISTGFVRFNLGTHPVHHPHTGLQSTPADVRQAHC